MTDLITARQDRLQTALGDAPFDAFLAASPANVHHAAGYRSVGERVFRQHQMAALMTPAGTTLVCPVADAGPAVDAGVGVEDLVCYGRFYFEATDASAVVPTLADQHASLTEATVTAIEKRMPFGGVLGVDMAGLGTHWASLEGVLPSGVSVVDASAWSLQVRAVKLPAEVELLRQAAALAEDGIERAMAKAGPGVTEHDLAAEVAHAMVAGRGEPRFLVVTSGPRSALADASPTDRKLEPGDLLRFDVGCVLDGYWSDIGRTAVVGEPSAVQQRRYDAILAGEQAQLDRLRPGITASQVFDIAVAEVEAHGLSPYRRQHCGHGIGGDVYEPPIINPEHDVPLEPGMTFCFETPYYELGWGGMMVEDALVVTAGGFEMLTSLDRSLWVVEA